MSDYQVLLCTCPDAASAEAVARHLVERRLAACVNILAGVTSVFAWQGKVETAEERLLVVKSRADRYPALERAIMQLHPYELPEIIAVPVVNGLPPYLAWIDDSVAKNDNE